MSTRFTARDLANITGRLQHFRDMPPEKISNLGHDACEPCDDPEGKRLFDALLQGEPTESEVVQFRLHVWQCTACQKFLRYVWRVCTFDGY